MNALNALTDLLNVWADGCTDDDIELCKPLLWLRDCSLDVEGQEPTKSDKDTIVLMQNYRKAPQMQYLLRCSIIGPSVDKPYQVPAPPFTLWVCDSHSRLGDKDMALCNCTSDELCESLLRRSGQWQAVQLLWTPVDDVPDLLVMRVDSVGARVFPKA